MNQENQPQRVLADKSNIKPEYVQGKKRAHAVMFLDAKKTKKNRIDAENQENAEPPKKVAEKPKIAKIKPIIPIPVKETVKVIEKVTKEVKVVVESKILPDENQENVAPINPFIKAEFENDEDDDPLMCAEYILDILSYLRKQEVKTLANDYTHASISTTDRFRISNDLIETHYMFKLLPETIYLACNIFDRVVTSSKVSRDQATAVMLVSLLIAGKYDEVSPPTVRHIVRRAHDLGLKFLTQEKVYDMENEILGAVSFDLSYPNPFNFLRRASKADDYNSETRTVAKYFMELSIVDHRLVAYAPSRIAAASFWCATMILLKCKWVYLIYLVGAI
eukprot:NODE_213_length_12556_cov_0.937063.p4 type:complete len:335 gc:universal NODE_213_length_12556_cov_0.937063:4000-5004(+)